MLLKGASPIIACQQCDCSFESYMRTLEEDEKFRERSFQIQQALVQNVAARLYQEAMKGSVSAMTFWLKHFGPNATTPLDETTPFAPEIESLTDEELHRLCRLYQLEVSTESEVERAA